MYKIFNTDSAPFIPGTKFDRPTHLFCQTKTAERARQALEKVVQDYIKTFSPDYKFELADLSSESIDHTNKDKVTIKTLFMPDDKIFGVVVYNFSRTIPLKRLFGAHWN